MSVTLVTAEGEYHTVPIDIAYQSDFIQLVLNESDAQDSEIPIPCVDAPTMKRIIEFLITTGDNTVELVNRCKTLPKEELANFLSATHYLNIKTLFNAAADAVAKILDDMKDVDQIADYLGVKKSQEELDEIKREIKWLDQ